MTLLELRELIESSINLPFYLGVLFVMAFILYLVNQSKDK